MSIFAGPNGTCSSCGHRHPYSVSCAVAHELASTNALARHAEQQVEAEGRRGVLERELLDLLARVREIERELDHV